MRLWKGLARKAGKPGDRDSVEVACGPGGGSDGCVRSGQESLTGVAAVKARVSVRLSSPTPTKVRRGTREVKEATAGAVGFRWSGRRRGNGW